MYTLNTFPDLFWAYGVIWLRVVVYLVLLTKNQRELARKLSETDRP